MPNAGKVTAAPAQASTESSLEQRMAALRGK
jgi:hypothetical protein